MSLTNLKTDARLGDAESQYLLGRAYDEGKLTERNLLEAISWYQKAADQGNLLACKELGIQSFLPIVVPYSDGGTKVTKIYGPPGTGKTRKLIEHIREAIFEGIEPDKIGFFSFTNKATEEAKSRMVTEFPHFDIESDFPYFQTVHSLANKALQTKVTVISDKQAKEFDPDVQIERPFMKEGDEKSQVVRIKHPVLDAATTARSLKVSLEKYLLDLPPSQRWPINKWLGIPFGMTSNPISKNGIILCLAYNHRYESYKKSLDVIDFADMLDRAVINKMSLPSLKLLLIDEAQDLSPTQWDIANVLISKADKVLIAGDDDQAICESFGASANHFLNLHGDELILEKSSRIPPGVHHHLCKLIPKLKDKNPSRKNKNWHPKDEVEYGEVFSFSESSKFLDYLVSTLNKEKNKDVLLMFVTNTSLRKFSSMLKTRGVSHYSANELVGLMQPSVRLLTIWGAKGGQAHMTALITSSEMDVRMLIEDPRLEYVAHSRAMHSFFYVGSYLGQEITRHAADFDVAETTNLPPPADQSAKEKSSNNISSQKPAILNARPIRSFFDNMDDDVPF